ncbi:NAD(P)-dependent oxidoreductase [uncultured Alsobacter sp.]|uniref:NAD(P)-dependent oxidoreductase n=1 Tax=uncultured Alsobacter sp. TaxID=1748258 RepID=UPI0025CFA527|nr:NAD(P)-dependent oxidoreductase [uncultured Alsobacter sp.]
MSDTGITAGRLPPDDYARNFADLHPPLDRYEAKVAADRCFFCYDAPCMTACPTTIDIPLFIRQIATGNATGAAKTILDSNIMGAMCARVCPTEQLCEEACVREALEGKPVEIGRLQRHATDALFATGKQLYQAGPSTGFRVAVVGGGPAGLSCAHRLATLGHTVTVFEAQKKLGGLNEYGIAAYKATNEIAQCEVGYILGVGGIEVKTGQALGRDIHLGDLARDYDAVFLGIGLAATNALGIADGGFAGVDDAVDYIAGLRQASDLSALPVGRRVVVIGGGMTAIDIATQVKRLGAEEVTIVYRRGPAEMGASPYEQEVAQTSGVTIRHWAMPKALVGANGRVTGIAFERTALADGKLTGTGETYELACDQLFRAIGQAFVASDLEDSLIELERGRIRVDGAQRTSHPKIWAGGDCVGSGSDLTVVAVEHGKQAALSIDSMLRAATAA